MALLLADGQLAASSATILGADGKVQSANLPDAVVSGGGTGDVIGPASVTANLVALFDGNTATIGNTCYIVTSGSCVVTCGSGAGVTANDRITASGAGGLGLTAAPGAGTNCAVVGVALTTTLAHGSTT